MEEATDMLMPVITMGVKCMEELSQMIMPPLAPSPVDSKQVLFCSVSGKTFPKDSMHFSWDKTLNDRGYEMGE